MSSFWNSFWQGYGGVDRAFESSRRRKIEDEERAEIKKNKDDEKAIYEEMAKTLGTDSPGLQKIPVQQPQDKPTTLSDLPPVEIVPPDQIENGLERVENTGAIEQAAAGQRNGVGLKPMGAKANPAMAAQPATFSMAGNLTQQDNSGQVPPMARNSPTLADASPMRQLQLQNEAHTRAYNLAMQRGQHKMALDIFVKSMPIRAQLRDQMRTQAEAQYRMTGDPKVFLPMYNETFGDGVRVNDIVVKSASDPATGAAVKRYFVTGETSGGEKFERDLSEKEFKAQLDFARDPKGAMAAETFHANELFKAAVEEEKERSKARARVEEDRGKWENRQAYDPSVRFFQPQEERDVFDLGRGGIRVKEGAPKQTNKKEDTPAVWIDKKMDGVRQYITAIKKDQISALTPDQKRQWNDDSVMVGNILRSNAGLPGMQEYDPATLLNIVIGLRTGAVQKGMVTLSDGTQRPGFVYEGKGFLLPYGMAKEVEKSAAPKEPPKVQTTPDGKPKPPPSGRGASGTVTPYTGARAEFDRGTDALGLVAGRVPSSTQKARDDDRLTILRQELVDLTKALETTRDPNKRQVISSGIESVRREISRATPGLTPITR